MSRVHLRLPATSANLGPGFDALALALKVYLDVDAEPSTEFAIEATGRNAEICGAAANNLLIETYSEVLAANHRPVVPLRLRMCNEIPLGMGCGSSAAVRLAGTALASEFGALGWERTRILDEATRREGHPDNAAACWLGGFVASCTRGDQVQAVSFAPPAEWRALIVMPERPLATTASRAALPDTYSRPDVVANLQRVAVLTAALAAGRADLIANAMRDTLHQPYRTAVCPLLPCLIPLAGADGILGVALSGAGPAVLLLVESEGAAAEARRLATATLGDSAQAEFLTCELESEPATLQVY